MMKQRDENFAQKRGAEGKGNKERYWQWKSLLDTDNF